MNIKYEPSLEPLNNTVLLTFAADNLTQPCRLLTGVKEEGGRVHEEEGHGVGTGYKPLAS